MGALDDLLAGVRSVGTVAVEQVQNYRTALDTVNRVAVPVNGFTPPNPGPTDLYNPGETNTFTMPTWGWVLIALAGGGLGLWVLKKVL